MKKEGEEMNYEKYIKFFPGFVAVALVISLVLNFNLLSRLDELENQLNYLSNNQTNIINRVSSQTSHIQNVLNDIQEQQSWISRIKMEMNTAQLENGETEASFEWQVKELQSNSEVVFNYVVGESDDYVAVPAKEIQQGLFQVKIPLKVSLNPQWEIGLTTSNSSNSHTEQVSKEMIEEQYRQNELKYFVSVSNGDTLKSGEIHTEHIGHYGTSYYGVLQTDVHLREEGFNVSLYHHNVNNATFVVEEAYLKVYDGQTYIGEEQIEPNEAKSAPEGRSRFFELNQDKKYENMKLVVKVIYDNGETFEQEIYSK